MFARATRQRTIPSISCRPARFVHSSYGNSQSGHQKSDAANPQVDQEHPGPEAPADQGTAKSSSSSAGSPESTTKGQSSTPSNSAPEKSASDKSTDKSTSSGAKAALLDPKQGGNADDPEVKEHNEDMRNRADQTPNQIS